MPVTIDYNIPLSYYSLNLENYSPIFCVGNHVLMEAFTGKTFMYKAVNIQTKKIIKLFYAKKQLTEKKYQTAAEKMAACCEIGTDRSQVTLKTGLDLLTEKARAIFAHVLTRYGYVTRDKQIELSTQMQAALYDNKILISEAAVGIGKTHAYLIAAVLHKLNGVNDFWIRSTYSLSRDFHPDTPMPVVISTSSIALQKAITQDYIPEISRILLENRLIRRPLSCVVRKGKEHYICDTRLKDYIPHADDKTKPALKSLLSGSTALDLGDMDYLTTYVKRKICVTDNCTLQCSYRESCRYLAFMKDMQSGRHDFQVCNHQYLLADLIHREQGMKPLIPNYQAVIIDEAHKLEQAAQTMYGTAFSNSEIPDIAQYVKSLTFTDKRLTKNLTSYTDRLLSLNNQLFAALCGSIPAIDTEDDETKRFPVFITGGVRATIRSLRYCLDALCERLSDNPGISKHQENLHSYTIYALQKLSECLRVFQSSNEIVYWLEMPKLTRKVTGEISLCCIPKRLGKYLHRDLWSKRFPIILTSGTLSAGGTSAAGGSFEYIRKRIGLDLVAKRRITETSKPSPFEYMKNCLIYISEVTPFPDNRSAAYIAAVTGEIERLIKATHGHAAVLFTSYRVMELVYMAVESRGLGYPLFKLNRSGRGSIQRFKESGNGILFASGSMWEGVDLPGDILSLLIIVRLPFQIPDPLSEYEQSQYSSMEEYKRLVIQPDMLLKAKQGAGRLLRLESDTGVLAFLDSRVRIGGTYRDALLDALPSCGVTGNVIDVAQFISTVKNHNYFNMGEK